MGRRGISTFHDRKVHGLIWDPTVCYKMDDLGSVKLEEEKKMNCGSYIFVEQLRRVAVIVKYEIS